MKDDPSSHRGELLCQVGVGNRGAAGIGPEVIANQAADGNPRPLVEAQGRYRIVLDLTAGRIGQAPAGQRFGVEAQIGSVRRIEADLVIAMAVVFDKAGAQGQP